MPRPLDADRIVAALRRPAGPWQQVDVASSIDSTNAESERAPMPWRLVTAAEQSAGRGRRARAWASPAGASVSVSVTMPSPTGVDLGWFPLVVGLAVRDALDDLCGAAVPIGLKWPNDVLAGADGRKLGGILCQVLPGDLLLAGVGVNVLADPELTAATQAGVGAPAPTPPTTLFDLLTDLPGVATPTREQVVVAIARALERRHARWSDAGAATLRQDYVRVCATLGRDVVVHLPHGRVEGVAVDIDEVGRLVVRSRAGGEAHAFIAGDVVHVRATEQA